MLRGRSVIDDVTMAITTAGHTILAHFIIERKVLTYVMDSLIDWNVAENTYVETGSKKYTKGTVTFIKSL